MTLKLFVADDSVTIQRIVSLAFSGEDVAIQSASDGNSALESIKSFKPDAVLADVFMPGCSGYEVCERIKSDPELHQVPVILLVGTFEPFDEKEAARVKCDGYLTKPFDTTELIQTVHSLVENRKAPRIREISAESTSSASRGTDPASGTLVSPATWESFLGEARILELFNPEALDSVKAGRAGADALLKPAVKSRPELPLSEESINLIVDKVVRRMSSEVIREVAWEVVPELSESIIRRIIQEQNK